MDSEDGLAHLLVRPVDLSDILVLFRQSLEDLLDAEDLLFLCFVGKVESTRTSECLLQGVQVLLYPFGVLQTELG